MIEENRKQFSRVTSWKIWWIFQGAENLCMVYERANSHQLCDESPEQLTRLHQMAENWIWRMKLTRAHLVIGIWDEYWTFLTESTCFNSSRVGAYTLTKANLEKLVRQRQAGKQSSLQNITEQLAGLQKWNEEIHVPAWNLGCRYNYGCGLKPPDCPTTNISSSTPLCSVCNIVIDVNT